MVAMYTGTPGSGKSIHAAQDVISWLRRGKGLIANFPVNEKAVGKCKSHAEYWDNPELTVQRLVQYAVEHRQLGKESSTLLIVDEAQIKFNCRDLQRKDRQDWVNFFSQHRKLGFDVILITQLDRMIDRQIRGMVETEFKHRKLNNYGAGGVILSVLTGFSKWFITIEYWYGGNKLKLSQRVFKYRKQYGEISDSYRLFADLAGCAWTDVVSGVPRSGGALEPAAGQEAAEQTGEEVIADDGGCSLPGGGDQSAVSVA